MWGNLFLIRFSLVITFSILYFANDVYAQRAFIFDYDGTIVEDRSDLGGNHNTPYKLFRVHYRSSTFQPEVEGPLFVEISQKDWEALTEPKYDPITKHPTPPNTFATSNTHLGSLTPYTLSDGRVIIPGFYRVYDPDSFYRYHASVDGENYFEQSFADAFEKTKRGEGKIQGEVFETFYQLINNPETRSYVFVVSSRGHSQEEIIEKLKNDRDVRGLISKDVTDSEIHLLAQRHFMLVRPEYQHFDNDMKMSRIPILKAQFVLEIVKAMIHVNPSRYIEMLDSKGERYIKGVEVVFFEDKFENIEATVREVQDIANRKSFLKFIVHNTGRESDILLSERPKTYVLTPFSIERSLKDSEIEGHSALSFLLRKKMNSLTCSQYFGGRS